MTEKQLIKNNFISVNGNNKNVVKILALVSSITYLFLLLLSIFIDSWYDYRKIYLIGFIINTLICKLSFIFSKPTNNVALPLGYINFITIGIINIVENSLGNVSSGIYIAYIALFPTVMMDDSYRIDIICLFISFIVMFSCLIANPISISFHYIITIFTSTIIGLLIGKEIRTRKLENMNASKTLFYQSNIDPLTELYNKRNFLADIDNTISGKIPAIIKGIIMIDIDFFKNYNDTYGHQEGDRCLKDISDVFKSIGRKHNIKFYRYGGEEFVGLDRSHTAKQLNVICEEINQQIFKKNIPFEKNKNNRVTVSIGYTTNNKKVTSYEDIIEQADQALYYSKSNGRNQHTYFNNINK